MGFFSNKSSSALPKEILDAVRTMQDDLDGKAPKPQVVKSSSIAGSGNASPFAFSAAPALKNMAPVNTNGLTSTITVTSVDTSHALPDPKKSSPFMQSETPAEEKTPVVSTPGTPSPEANAASVPSKTADSFPVSIPDTPSSLSLDPLPPSVVPPPKPTPTKLFSTLDPEKIPISFSKDTTPGNATFVSENVTLGSSDPVYSDSAPEKKSNNVFVAGVILLVLAVVAGGAFAYFSFIAKKPVVMVETPVETIAAPIEPESITSTVPEDQPFSLSTPNYLTLDVETVTAEQFRGVLSAKERLIESNNLTETPIEFFVTDKNNTPVAFVRFAALMGMKLPQAMMDQLDESFSLYLYSDGKVARVGLALSMKDKDLLMHAVTSEEGAIPFALQALYLDPAVTKIATPVFKSGTYKTYSTRYFNIASTGLSNDYTFVNKHWVIGTSAIAFRKILDTFGTAL